MNMNMNDDKNKTIESLLLDFKETVMRLSYLNLLLEDRLQKEKGLKFNDIIFYLDKKFKEAIKEQRDQQGERKYITDDNDDVFLNRYQHFQ